MIYPHAGHTPRDPGACYGGLEEHAITMQVRDLVAADLGGLAQVTPEGLDYQAVQRWVLAQLPGLLVALHVNAGGGSYGAVFGSLQSDHGCRASGLLRLALRSQYPAIDWRIYTLPSPGWERAWGCIRLVSQSPTAHSAVLVEMGFIDTPAHAHLYTDDGIEAMARAISGALRAYSHQEPPCP